MYVIPNEYALNHNLNSDMQRLAYATWCSGLGLACLSLGMMHYHVLKVLGRENQHLTSGFYAIIFQSIGLTKDLKRRCDACFIKIHKRRHNCKVAKGGEKAI